jgi:putative ABC transport system ATP-binding protein
MMIQAEGLCKSYRIQQNARPIIEIKRWSVDAGERIALLGPSGSGKSTLLHILGGVLMPDSGKLEIAGFDLSAMSEPERDAYRADMIGYVFQDFYLIPSLSIRQNVELVLSRKLNRGERDDLLEHYFRRVGLLEHMNKLPHKLSRGQQQRAAIVRAIANRPTLILADEPTGSLDWETADGVMRLLLEVCEENGSTLITVTHDLHLAELFPAKLHISEINGAGRREQPKENGYKAAAGGVGS